MNADWERVCKDPVSDVERLAVPGGWLYRVASVSRSAGGRVWDISVVFVPAPTDAAPALPAR